MHIVMFFDPYSVRIYQPVHGGDHIFAYGFQDRCRAGLFHPLFRQWEEFDEEGRDVYLGFQPGLVYKYYFIAILICCIGPYSCKGRE